MEEQPLSQDTQTLEEKIRPLIGKMPEHRIAKQVGASRMKVARIVVKLQTEAALGKQLGDPPASNHIKANPALLQPPTFGSSSLETAVVDKTKPQELPPSEVGAISEEGRSLVEREMLLMATPLIQKVLLGPKTRIYFDITREELKEQLPENYDFGDFLTECVEFFMKYGLKGTLKWVKETVI